VSGDQFTVVWVDILQRFGIDDSLIP